jgi:hypothetical protein
MSEKSVILAIRPQSSRRQALAPSGVWKTFSAVVDPSDPHAIKRLVFVESEIEVIGATRPAHFITRGTRTSCHHFLKSSNDTPSGRFRLPNTLWYLPIAYSACWK